MISERFWQARFGGEPGVVGRSVRINGQPVTVIGIAPKDFLGASPMLAAADLWLPTTLNPRAAPELARDRLEQARNDPGEDRKGRRVTLAPGGRLFPIRDQDLPALIGFPLVLIGLILWIACASVATMLVARGIARRKEIAVRLAMGASRGRIERQLLAESMLLAGLAPALHATREGIAPALKTGLPVRIRGYRWFSLRNVLALQQVACSLALLLLTGFMVLGFYRSSSVELGFDARHVHLVTLDAVRDGYSPARAAGFFARLPERVRRIPGVTAASLSQSAPMIGEQVVVTKPESDRDSKVVRTVNGERVGARYFETLRIPILTGRDFRETDQKDDSRAAIVNQMLARQLWPGQDAVGRRLEAEGTVYKIIGVARDVRSTLPLVPARPCVYRPLPPSDFSRPPIEGVQLVVRAEPGVNAAVQLRHDLAAIDPNVTVFKASTMTDEVNQMLYLVRASTTVYGAAGLFGLVLAAVGLAGVTAQAVARRSHEIWIRIALGAGRGDVLWLVLREGAVLVIIGTLFGQVAAFAVIRVLRTILAALAEMTRVSASDPLLLIGASLLLAAVAMLACYLPARRSARIDPASGAAGRVISLHAGPAPRVKSFVTRFVSAVCLLAVSAWAAAPDLMDILKGVENRYNRAQTVEVLFQQTYTAPRRGAKTESGQLFLRKPGRMRWQYTTPPGKLFVSDGKYIYLYTPAANRVERSKVKETDDMRAPLAFLLGKLDFHRDFKRFITRQRGSDFSITAEPRSGRAPFSQVEFRVGPAFEIRELEVTGQDNSVMQFRFENEKLNPPLSDKLFRFQPPPGAEMVDEAP